MLKRRGTLVLTGIFLKPMPIDTFALLTKELTLTGAWGYEHWTRMKEFALSLDLLERGRIDASRIITHKYPLDRVSEAYETALDKKKTESIKVQIVF